MRFLFTLLLSALLAHATAAQEHPFLSVYTLTELPGAIRVDWTILGGSTCDGQQVERSTDGSSFTPAHTISGLCGDPTIAKSYSWTDLMPPELSTVHYRIKLGVEGYSSIKAVDFDQLTTSTQRFYPNPAGATATLLLNLPPSASVNMLVVDAQGRTVLEINGHSGPAFELDLRTLPAGAYTYQATSGGQRFTGTFVKS